MHAAFAFLITCLFGDAICIAQEPPPPTPEQVQASKMAFKSLGGFYEFNKHPTRTKPYHMFTLPKTATDVQLKKLPQVPFGFWLALGFSDVTDAGLKELKNVKNLQGLYLGSTKVTN